MKSVRIGLGILVMGALSVACGSSSDSGVSYGASTGGAGTGGFSTGGFSTGGTGGFSTGGSSTGGSGTGGSGTGGSGTGGSGTGGSGGSSGKPICLGPQAGAYCGGDVMQGADPNTLYQCPGPNKPPTSSTSCANGCVVETQGTADHCKVVASTNSFRLPWQPGVSMKLTQDCNDSCCNDHVKDDRWAWDFANGTQFTVVAARGGTVTHLKINSLKGCGSSSCVNDVNFIVIDHGDGTQATYLHLAGNSLVAGVTCGAAVKRGQPLAKADSTGWATGAHLHFQVSKVHPGAKTCECGSTGQGCAAGSVPWSSFWSTATYPTQPVQFDEWPASTACANRRITMPASQNQ